MVYLPHKLQSSVDRGPSKQRYLGGGNSLYGPEGGTGHVGGAPMDTRSEDNRSQQGDGEPPSVRHLKSHSKMVGLHSEITQLEQRIAWLDHRNRWLSSKMMAVQKSFITSMFNVGSKVLRQRCFKGWSEAMSELRLEHQLQEQTRSLDQIQQVAHNLGACLGEEQEQRRAVEAAHANLQEEISRIYASNDGMKRKVDGSNDRIAKLEQILFTAESYLDKKQSHAVNVVEEGKKYEKRKVSLEAEYQDAGRERPQTYTLEESVRLREQTYETMQKAQTWLPRAVSSSASPAQPTGLLLTTYGAPSAAKPRSVMADTRVLATQSFAQQAEVQALKDEFASMDADGDGVITREEFNAAQRRKAEHCPACGDQFMLEAVFCRKCGMKRPEGQMIYAMQPRMAVSAPVTIAPAATLHRAMTPPAPGSPVQILGGNVNLMPRTPILAQRPMSPMVINAPMATSIQRVAPMLQQAPILTTPGTTSPMMGGLRSVPYPDPYGASPLGESVVIEQPPWWMVRKTPVQAQR